MNSRKMKRELWGYIGVYLEDFPLSDFSHNMDLLLLGDNPTEAHRRRYLKVKMETIHQLKMMAYKAGPR